MGKYALKRQKILNSEVEKSTKSKIWREIKFATSNGYYHTDIHSKNVAYKKTNKEYIKIFDNNVPTYGYIWSFIDYGEILSKKSDPNINEYLHSFIELSDAYYNIININEPKELVKYFYQKLK
jgi:hypothetical protein